MPKILLVEDNKLDRDMLPRRLIGGVERIIPKRAYHREELLREGGRLLGAAVVRAASSGEEKLQ
jgi:CheY-like chemotaxis protein